MNPLQLIQVLRASSNPQAYMESIAGNNPLIAKALQMQKEAPNGDMMQVAQNLAKAQGVNLDQLKKTLGV